MKTWQKGKRRGMGNETAKRKEKGLASVGGLGGVCYDMEIPACWSCWPVWGLDRQEGLRAQLTPIWCWLEQEYKE